MKKIREKTLTQYIRPHLTSNNWVEVNDYNFLKLKTIHESFLVDPSIQEEYLH